VCFRTRQVQYRDSARTIAFAGGPIGAGLDSSSRVCQDSAGVPACPGDSMSKAARLRVAMFLAAVLVAAPASSTPGWPRTPAGGGATLELVVTGKDGVVSISGADDCPTLNEKGDHCSVTVPVGTSITLAPVSGNLVAWSLYECPGTTQCVIQMDSDRSVVATFAPTSLRVLVEGDGPTADPPGGLGNGGGTGLLDDAGTPLLDNQGKPIFGNVTTTDGKINCTTPPKTEFDCFNNDYSPFDEVTLVATPGGRFDRWAGECKGTDGPTCTLRLSGDDVVGAIFKSDTDFLNVIPPRQTVELRVVVDSAGVGTVNVSRSQSGEAITSCSSVCKANFEQGEVPALTAAPSAAFVEWRGGAPYCTTNPSCRFPAFLATSIRAVFRSTTTTTTATTTTTTTATTTTTTTPTTTTSTTAKTTTTTTTTGSSKSHPGPPKLVLLAPANVALKAHRKGGFVFVATKLLVNEAALLRVQAINPRTGKALPLANDSAIRTTLAAHKRLRLRVPRASRLQIRVGVPSAAVVKGKRYLLVVRATDTDREQSTLRIPFRR
jgi:hypothetical protein